MDEPDYLNQNLDEELMMVIEAALKPYKDSHSFVFGFKPKDHKRSLATWITAKGADPRDGFVVLATILDQMSEAQAEVLKDSLSDMSKWIMSAIGAETVDRKTIDPIKLRQ